MGQSLGTTDAGQARRDDEKRHTASVSSGLHNHTAAGGLRLVIRVVPAATA